MKEPVISIIVPCFNQGHYLSECLRSVRSQKFLNWECIIIDDGSTDDTKKVAKSFCDYDNRFNYYYQANKGLSGARNSGIDLARGSFMLFLDSDDSLEPSALQRLWFAFQSDPDLVMVFCGYYATNQKLNNTIKTVINGFVRNRESFFEKLAFANLLPIHTALIRKEVFESIGTFDESLKSCEDWDFWLRLGRITNQIGYVPEALVRYRMTLGSMTRNVDTFFQAGMIVIDRIKNYDDRVVNSDPRYVNGIDNYTNEARLIWYKKVIGLYLGQNKSESPLLLLDNLFDNYKIELTESDFLDVWKHLLFGALLTNKRLKAWIEYRQMFEEFLLKVEIKYKSIGLVDRAIEKIVFFNMPFYLRPIGKVLIRLKLI